MYLFDDVELVIFCSYAIIYSFESPNDIFLIIFILINAQMRINALFCFHLHIFLRLIHANKVVAIL